MQPPDSDKLSPRGPQAIVLDHHGLAGSDPLRLDQAAEQDELSFAQPLPRWARLLANHTSASSGSPRMSLPYPIRPGPASMRILARTRRAGLGSKSGTGRPSTQPAPKKVVGDERRRPERGVIHIPIVDDLDRRHARANGAGRRDAVPTDACGRPEILVEQHGDFAFDADTHEVGMREASILAPDRRGENRPCAWVGNPQVPLHYPRRAADFVPDDAAPAGAGQARMQCVLNGIRVDLVARLEIGRQAIERHPVLSSRAHLRRGQMKTRVHRPCTPYQGSQVSGRSWM